MTLFKAGSLKSILFLFMLLIGGRVAFGQWETDYTPLSTQSPKLGAALTELKAMQDERMAKIDPKRQKLLYEAMTERFSSTQTKIENGHLLSDPEYDRYLGNILQEIFDSNPQLPKSQIRLLLARYPWPNASSHGEGTVLLNIGLVPHLENESQLAFVLCHEIAHYFLNHVDNAILKRVALQESEATKKQMEDISKTEYGARAKALALVKEISYDARRHSRLYEVQADSMALELLLRTDYDASEALKCLGILDNIDDEDSTKIELQALFDSKELPFNPAWLRIEESPFGHSKSEGELNEDSLKTHPDCANRIAMLVPKLENYAFKGKSANLQGGEAFQRFAMTCTFELGRSYYFFDDLGKCLHQTILLLQQYPKNTYLVGIVGMCLNRIFIAQKNHEQGKYVAMPNQELSAQYNLILNFIQNIRLSELGKLAYYFLQPRIGEPENEYLLYAWWGSCRIVGDLEGQEKAKTNYLQRFPKGEFIDQMKTE